MAGNERQPVNAHAEYEHGSRNVDYGAQHYPTRAFRGIRFFQFPDGSKFRGRSILQWNR